MLSVLCDCESTMVDMMKTAWSSDFSLADLHFPSTFTEISSFFPRLTVTPFQKLP